MTRKYEDLTDAERRQVKEDYRDAMDFVAFLLAPSRHRVEPFDEFV